MRRVYIVAFTMTGGGVYYYGRDGWPVRSADYAVAFDSRERAVRRAEQAIEHFREEQSPLTDRVTGMQVMGITKRQ